MDIKSQISLWMDEHSRELFADVARLVKIESVRSAPAPGAPFGPGPRKALDEALQICRGFGFDTSVYGEVVGSADMGAAPARLDILAHLDVVDAGLGWESEPFTLTEKDGMLFGRGADDDKGPAVEAMYAMRCVKELGLPLSGGVRLILGTGEECGSDDLPAYYNDHAPAPMTFTPDSGFPVYNTEKGMYRPELTAKWTASQALPRVSAIEAGVRVNVIPAIARASVLGMDAQAIEPYLHGALPEGIKLYITAIEGGCELTVHGFQGHAAWPEGAKNALTALLGVLAILPLAPCGSAYAIKTLSAAVPHGDYYGKALGVSQSDETSGPLTLAFTMLTLCETGLEAKFDLRTPLCADDDNCRNVLESALASSGFRVSGDMLPAHHTPGDGEFVKTLLRCYETFTGRRGECFYTGGQTYVHDIPGGVAFGAGMPGFDSHLHGANERISAADALTAAKIFALAIAELCK